MIVLNYELKDPVSDANGSMPIDTLYRDTLVNVEIYFINHERSEELLKPFPLREIVSGDRFQRN